MMTPNSWLLLQLSILKVVELIFWHFTSVDKIVSVGDALKT